MTAEKDNQKNNHICSFMSFDTKTYWDIQTGSMPREKGSG